jgi:hypothetical protein
MIGVYLLLNLAVLWTVARASSASGWRLVLMLFLLAFVAGSANNLIEAVFFGVLSWRQAAWAAVPAAIIFSILSPVAVLISGRWRTGSDAPLVEGGFTPLTLAGVVVAYQILYWTAGTLVYPYIADFYATTRALPPVYQVAAMQIVRSLIFAGAAYPLLRRGLSAAPLVLALVYSVIGGVAPMLPDNPYMPPDIRFYHGVETSSSNFLFGLLVGYLLTRRRPAVPAQA